MLTTETTHSSPELLALREKVHVLTDLNARIQSLRQIPAILLRSPAAASLLESHTDQLKREAKKVQDVVDELHAEQVQSALQAARESEQKDKSGLAATTVRRVNRKRRRPPSPDFPQPYRPFQQAKAVPVFPESPDGAPPTTLGGLPDLIRAHNRAHAGSKLGIWLPARGRRLACPVVLRFAIPDVVVIYFTVDHTAEGAPLVVENATAFGSREKKPPHSQSDYTLFQKISQQIARMLQAQPDAPLQAVVSLLDSYEVLFVNRCTICQRVLSIEGHVPPIARVWTDSAPEGSTAGWQPRHPTCR